jgi:hypothetical protein
MVCIGGIGGDELYDEKTRARKSRLTVSLKRLYSDTFIRAADFDNKI